MVVDDVENWWNEEVEVVVECGFACWVGEAGVGVEDGC